MKCQIFTDQTKLFDLGPEHTSSNPLSQDSGLRSNVNDGGSDDPSAWMDGHDDDHFYFVARTSAGEYSLFRGSVSDPKLIGESESLLRSSEPIFGAVNPSTKDLVAISGNSIQIMRFFGNQMTSQSITQTFPNSPQIAMVGTNIVIYSGDRLLVLEEKEGTYILRDLADPTVVEITGLLMYQLDKEKLIFSAPGATGGVKNMLYAP